MTVHLSKPPTRRPLVIHDDEGNRVVDLFIDAKGRLDARYDEERLTPAAARLIEALLAINATTDEPEVPRSERPSLQARVDGLQNMPGREMNRAHVQVQIFGGAAGARYDRGTRALLGSLTCRPAEAVELARRIEDGE